ncbi:MAG TPA: antitoxin family protein [Blastocatellia bacterium]|jgi:predicted DNA-binding antitoxin AbrB/MazE fold protein|nr:antitoxin family protein [Blastocatellia bacterium]
MTISVEAIYEGGVLRPLWPLDLAEGTKIAVLLVEPIAAKLEVMREAMTDPLFLADLDEVAEDFKYVDAEGEAQ